MPREKLFFKFGKITGNSNKTTERSGWRKWSDWVLL